MGLREKLEGWRQELESPQKRGKRFEVLVRYYLRHAPEYRNLFSGVWLWEDWPERHSEFPSEKDIGIDLVAELASVSGRQRFCAIQCKFYSTGQIGLDRLGTFLGASEAGCFRERWLVATVQLSEQALKQLKMPDRQGPGFHLLTLEDMEASALDWDKLDWSVPDAPQLPVRSPRTSLPHQVEAVGAVCDGLAVHQRGQLIMACGTGKTHVALRVAERLAARPQGEETGRKPDDRPDENVPLTNGRPGRVLFLAPSIALVGQSLRAWASDATAPLQAVVVCSDRTVGRAARREEEEDLLPEEIPYPVTTSAARLRELLAAPPPGVALQVVFSTYQSLPVVVEMQQDCPGWDFDLVIADEAHRTTGYHAPGEEASVFTLVHDAQKLRSAKRLYMTATPRMYAPASKERAAGENIRLYSMDDPEQYGPVLHELTFANAVEKGILSDYRVLVLAVSNAWVSQLMGGQGGNQSRELDLGDTAKLVGCWNGLAKRLHAEDMVFLDGDTRPMRTALGFANSIRASRQIADQFRWVSDVLAGMASEGTRYHVRAQHVDGTMDAVTRQRSLQWLAQGDDAAGGTDGCRVLMNARCLTEGVDVPELDAIVFFQPRRSFVDVVQAVGRVMRRSPKGGKRFGYVILPVVIPEGKDPAAALADHDQYGIIWQVINALRSHDERLERELAQIELQGQAPDGRIRCIGIGVGERSRGEGEMRQLPLAFSPEEMGVWRQAILARLVDRCGRRDYWKQWAREVTDIAQAHVTILRTEYERAKKQAGADGFAARFDAFLKGLRATLRSDISAEDGFEMLAQHLVTRPVFDALFADYPFASRNPVSVDLERVLAPLEAQGIARERQKLEGFYRSVRQRVEGITRPEARQTVLMELYRDFFQLAFPKMAEQLGIVYTPVEVVDFMLHSVDWALQEHFQHVLGDAEVDVLDPFAGTGTFIVRLLELGLIKRENLEGWYRERLHANEIVLLAYYLAAINIEEAFHRVQGGDYAPFPGMVLADTFRLQEIQPGNLLEGFQGNNARVQRQKERPIQVIIGNPPYSAWQTNANENNPNRSYPQLDARIRSTYGEEARATNRNSLYDHYIRAFRWAGDRIGDRGVIAFVTNGGWLDSMTGAGFRRALREEFSDVYVLNLRGNTRSQGELARKEGGQVFGSGSRATIAITLLVRKPDRKPGQLGRIHYHDIGDYLTREEKLARLREFRDAGQVVWQEIQPDAHHDWLNQRRADFEGLVPLAASASSESPGIFVINSNGVKTNRDIWIYHPDKKELQTITGKMVDFFHEQQASVLPRLPDHLPAEKRAEEATGMVVYDPRRIKWGRELFQTLVRREKIKVSNDDFRPALYRPFFPLTMAFHPRLNSCLYRQPEIFPEPGLENLVILVEGPGGKKGFSCLMTDRVSDIHVLSATQCFPRYRYVKRSGQPELSTAEPAPDTAPEQWVKENAITDAALTFFRQHHQCPHLTKDDLFYYTYGVLHVPEYRKLYANNLMRELPRIPPGRNLETFEQITAIGRKLAQLHLNYATQERLPGVMEEKRIPENMTEKEGYQVKKMAFGAAARDASGRERTQADKSVIVFNDWITLRNIPPEVYTYVINGKSAVEWVMERYAVKTDKETGITWDPDAFVVQSGNPRYVLDLLHSVIAVSYRTCELVGQLPSPF